MESFLQFISRLVASGIAIVWVWLEPTLPYAFICVFAVLLDCVSAWRLNMRIRKAYPQAKADGKLKSSHMSKMIVDLIQVWLCILLATLVDNVLLDHWGLLHLGEYVAAIFVLCTVVSILENESSCNGHPWAKLIQKIVASKVSRHIDMTEEEFNAILKDGNQDTAHSTKE